MENLSEEKKVEVPEESNFKKFLPFKAHYFVFMSGTSAIIPYLFIYAKQLGITADVVGYITSALWCITVLSRPLIGGLADHFHQRLKLVLLCLLCTSIVTGAGLSLIPQPPQANSPNSTSDSSGMCHQNNSYLVEPTPTDCAKCCPLSCSLCEVDSSGCGNVSLPLLEQLEGRLPLECSEDSVSKCLEGALKENCRILAGSNSTDSFVAENGILQVGLFGLFCTLCMVSQTSLESLTDAACAKNLGDNMEDFGKQRMWGTIGWAIFALAAGGLNHAFSASNSVTNYLPGFYMAVAFYTLDIFVLLKLKLTIPRSARSIFRNVARLLLKPRIVIFLLEVTAGGLIRGVYMTYSLWYLESIGASPLLLGSVTSAQCFLGEIPFLFFSGWIIGKIGHLNVFTLSFVAHGVRFLAYSFLANPWWVILIEVLQGPSFGSFYAAITGYGKLLAPPGAEATVQGISLAALDGVGTSLGTLIGGYWVHHAGGRETFFQVGIWSFVFGMVSCVLNGLIMCRLVQ